jgi:hypothetical protein
VRHLRDAAGWSWLNSHLLAARLVDTAIGWLDIDGTVVDALRLRLSTVQPDELRLEGEENEGRRVTEAVLAGAGAGAERAAAA